MKKIIKITAALAIFLAINSVVFAKTSSTSKTTTAQSKTSTSTAPTTTKRPAADTQASSQSQQTAQSANNQNAPIPAEMQVPTAFINGKVVKILKDENITTDNGVQPYQQLQVLVNEAGTIGKTVTIDYGKDTAIRPEQKLQVGDEVILAKVNDAQNPYYIYDKNRLPTVYFMCFIFVLMVIIFAGRKGAFSILGLLMSVLVLVNFIVPNIVAGHSPLMISLIGSLMIVLVSLYLSHGFNKRTTLALFATLITLVFAVLAAIYFVKLASITGLGSDDSLYLQSGPFGNLNLQGLLLGGIIIGALGVLDDVTTGQTAAVDEIHKANPALGFKELYFRGLSVGHEHIASLVNTLALAYAGASLPLFLIFKVSNDIPFWVNLNSEAIIEEVVRTFVGSCALILAVPISTFFAAYFLSKDKNVTKSKPSANHHHHHA